jgi:hypothetical protein
MTPGDSASSLAGISGPPRRLDAVQVQLTIDRLGRRILARFPDRNLGLVAGQLSALAGGAAGDQLTWFPTRLTSSPVPRDRTQMFPSFEAPGPK